MMNTKRLFYMIEMCRTEGRHLSKWEENFIEEVDERLMLDHTLSEREEEILTRIYEDRTNA